MTTNTIVRSTVPPIAHLCKHPLTILSEFEEFCTPIYVDHNTDQVRGEFIVVPEKAQERRLIRRQLLQEHLQETQTVAPFLVWKRKRDLVIVDGRHEEYQVAVEMGLPIQIVELNFDSLESARLFVIKHVLNQSHLNVVQRMMLVRHFRESIRKIARQYQGRRNDLIPTSLQVAGKFHTIKVLAALANVGELTFRRFNDIIEKGPLYLRAGKTEEFLDRLLAGTMSVNQAHNSLMEAIKSQREAKDFIDEHPEVFFIEDEPVSQQKTRKGDDSCYQYSALYENWHNRIVCGDRVQVLKHLPNACCNLILTSPEYNVEGIHYEPPVPTLPHKEYLEHLNRLWMECGRLLRDGGRLAINIPTLVSLFEEGKRAFSRPLFMAIVNEIENLPIGLSLREINVWHKRMPVRRHHMSNPSPVNPCYRADHEYILILSKNGWQMTPEHEGAPHDLTKIVYEEFSSSVISLPPQGKGVGSHPAVFPEGLAEQIIRMHSFIGDTVIDPSNGSGTTTAVAARLGRRWFGCDISPKYCVTAEKRTQKAFDEFQTNQTEDKGSAPEQQEISVA